MQTLTMDEINEVSGANGGELAFGIASGWASTVSGGAAGYIITNAARGALVGGAVGFAVGTLIGIGFYLATSDD